MSTNDAVAKDDKHLVALLQEAKSRASELRQVLVTRQELRAANVNLTRPDDHDLKKLDSSVKRNTALIKKLRLLSEESRESLLEDVAKVNQSKYVSEAVAAIADSPLKSRDVNAAVQVCCLLHQRYTDFATGLLPALTKLFAPSSRSLSDDDKAMVLKKRGVLRLLAELLLVGVYNDPNLLLHILSDLAATDLNRDREAGNNSLALLATFAKTFREEFLGLPQAQAGGSSTAALLTGAVQQEEEEQSAAVVQARADWAEEQSRLESDQAAAFKLPAAVQQQYLSVVERVFQSGCSALVSCHHQLQDRERSNAHVLDHRGELPEELSALYEKQRKLYEGLYRSLASLSELVEKPLPELADSGMSRVTAQEQAAANKDGPAMPSSPFEDEETRAFYESLPDLRALVPAVLLQGGQQGSKEQQQGANKAAKEGEPSESSNKADTTPGDSSTPPEDASAASASAAAAVDPTDAVPSTTAAEVDALLSTITTCVRQELCDELCVNFCFLNSRAARRRLVRVLCDLQGANMQLLPFYARIAATLGQIFSDVPSGVVKHVEDEVSTLLARKDHTNRGLETRLRVMRYLGELTKFALLPYGSVFSCLKSLLDEFRDQAVDMAATLVETAGRYLYLLPETHTRMANMVEVMMKLKNARNLDARQSMLVDSAYFQCKPPERASQRAKQRPPIQQYIRHLIFERLDKGEVQQVVRKLRRLPWPDHEAYIVKCILKCCRKGRFSNIPRLASMTAGLSKYHSSMGVRAVDEVVEAVRQAVLEDGGTTGSYQAHVADMHLLGEMYNYRLIDSRLVFDELYFILMAGYENPEEAHKADPQFNYFRIRLVAALMDSCGQYFSKGSARKRLDRFLVYFQRYILSKPPLAVDVEFDVQDLFEKLRPELQRYSTFEDAVTAVSELEAAEAAAAQLGEEEGVGVDDSESEGEGRGDDHDSDDKEGEGAGSEDDDDVEQSGALSDDSDDVTLVLTNPQAVEKDDQFEAEFAQMMQEVQTKAVAFVGAPPPRPAAPQVTADDVSNDVTMTFKVLMKRGGRDDKSHQLHLPASATMAVNLRTKAAQEAHEKALMKKLVLEANRRDEQSAATSSTGGHRHDRRGGTVILRTGRQRGYH